MATIKQRIDGVTESVIDGKAEIASAITDMGVDTDSDATFSVMAEHIRMLPIQKCDEVYIYVDSNGYVVMDCAYPDDASIYYRKKGDTDWIYYTSSFYITETAIYEAYAIKTGYLRSDIMEVECSPLTSYKCNYNTTINIQNSSSKTAFERIYCSYNSIGSFCGFLGGSISAGNSSRNTQSGTLSLPSQSFTPTTIYVTSPNGGLKMRVHVTLNGKVIIDESGIDAAVNSYPITIYNRIPLYSGNSDSYVVTVTFSD